MTVNPKLPEWFREYLIGLEYQRKVELSQVFREKSERDLRREMWRLLMQE